MHYKLDKQELGRNLQGAKASPGHPPTCSVWFHLGLLHTILDEHRLKCRIMMWFSSDLTINWNKFLFTKA